MTGKVCSPAFSQSQRPSRHAKKQSTNATDFRVHFGHGSIKQEVLCKLVVIGSERGVQEDGVEGSQIAGAFAHEAPQEVEEGSEADLRLAVTEMC